jgi:polyisoprenoid-binding protein YceI
MRIRYCIPFAVLASFQAGAAVEHYTIDPNHTYPSFEAPHIGGISFWRGKFDRSSGTVTLDRAARTGSVSIVIDATSVDFGHEKMNIHAKGPDLFDVEKYPTATYQSSSIDFDGDTPVGVHGSLTLHGVTKPVFLQIASFKCIMHPMLKREVCGADAKAEIDRTDFDMGYGVGQGIPSGKVTLAIQVEAFKDPPPSN